MFKFPKVIKNSFQSNFYVLVIMKNVGTTAVTYEWKKIVRGDFISSKKSDGIQRFYCHYGRDFLKPGESRTFIFSFRSDMAGMFNEEWELLTEPQLLEAVPILNLSGMATKQDEFIGKRDDLNNAFEVEVAKRGEVEISDFMSTHGALTPAHQPEESFGEKFERINKHLGMKYNKSVYAGFKTLYNLVVKRLGVQ